MTTNKANPKRLEVVCTGDGGCIFSQTSSCYYGEAGTLGWSLAGRAFLVGHEKPTVHLYRGGQLIERVEPSREQAMSLYYRGSRFWACNNTTPGRDDNANAETA